MCGIAGILARTGETVAPGRVEQMVSRLRHRGPDASGTWIDSDNTVGLGHARLSILDLSQLGAQPMKSCSGRYVITYNGEIYNCYELRQELQSAGFRFRGHSDTEIMLAAFERWGIRGALPRLRGMFAFAVWDDSDKKLWLARDRIGIKPLYYTETGTDFIFASELRAIRSGSNSPLKISQEGLSAYLRYGYIPGSLSIFSNVKKLQPGMVLVVGRHGTAHQEAYWNLDDVAQEGLQNPIPGDEADAVVELEARLRKAVREHMVADVPIGAFLSGGIDSSTVTALMQAESNRKINTFSVGFHEKAYNEADHAAAVARHLGTSHTELYVSDVDIIDVIPHIPDIYDEPFADVSQIPTYLVSQLARQSVTVALSGDGGDELFGGYNRYLFVAKFWNRLRHLPLSARKVLASALERVRPNRWDALFAAVYAVAPRFSLPSLPAQKALKVAALLKAGSIEELQQSIVSQWATPHHVLRDGTFNAPVEKANALAKAGNAVSQQMLWDMHNYLVDDILTKLDRASMHVGLEARVPLLDHSLVEFAWRIPFGQKIRNGESKWILRRVLERFVPRAIFDRPKMGFAIPIDEWLRGALRDLAEPYLNRAHIEKSGYLDPDVVCKTWEQHLSGRVNRGGALWTVLMFEIWLERMARWA